MTHANNLTGKLVTFIPSVTDGKYRATDAEVNQWWYQWLSTKEAVAISECLKETKSKTATSKVRL